MLLPPIEEVEIGMLGPTDAVDTFKQHLKLLSAQAANYLIAVVHSFV